ncbi:tripartite tricarboxylate transporter substrate binding protein [Paenalcaligenes niemegkensis]|uniref:Bug family tripartite tricarboxylate transporter substrate binding protein n=1 Tax=Paenalcaligenes niemegkensis TaxID=2895469 RepID=UPI001EE80EC8|nr:tripartite tricarboxylate transporter substrate binding protein [Paenalcaligenes niemegkensis]MCQ9617711.1 tripartite tricarboxylate transporter substrate binding protein [Paenalcaligenes niemegkensis]
MHIVKKLLSAVVATSAVLSTAAVAAEDVNKYPSRMVTIVAPYSPGGATDMFSRTLAQGLHETFDETVIVENRAGASGVIGAEHVSRAKPDGYTLVVGAVSLHAILPSLMQKMEKAQGNLTPVATLANSPSYVVVSANSSVETIEDLIAVLKAEPGKYMYGSAGLGTSQHMLAELFKQKADVDVMHVPYKSSGEMVLDLIANRVNMAVEQGPAILSHVRNGSLRILATTVSERTDEMPDVPTLGESVLPGFEGNTWFAVYAPKGTPEPIVEKLNVAISEVVQKPEVEKVLRSQGVVPMRSSVAELAAMEAADREMWRNVINAGEISIE